MKKLVTSLLQKRAKALLEKHKPTVVGITGSVGKTSAKRAITMVLRRKYNVRTAQKNFNNEIGVPLAILGMKSPGRSILGWLSVFWRSYRMDSMPEMLVLELGADHPGDIKALCDLVSPSVGVVTGISTVHAEFFADVDALAKEKGYLIEQLPADGLAILNGDDDRVVAMKERSSAPARTYGTRSLDFYAENIGLSTRVDESFEPGEVFAITQADIKAGGQPIGQLRLENDIGYAPVMACLAALAVADHFSVPFADAIDVLNKEFRPMPGRLHPIAGIKGSLIIDDSYNAAPAAMSNGLDVLKMFDPGEEYDRRIAALGSMAELGQYTEQEHRMIGMKVAEVADLFLAVGKNMTVAVEAAKEAGMDEDAVEWFATSEEAGRYLDRVVKGGDVVYVKGAQSARMEKVVKDVMAEPALADRLLVRQEGNWLKR